EAGGVGAELAGALQRNGLAVEGADEQHLLEQRNERLGVLERLGQRGDGFAVRAEVLQVLDIEFRGDGHAVGPRWRQNRNCSESAPSGAFPVRNLAAMSIDRNERPLEAEIHTDLSGRLSYGGYL